MSRKHAKSSSSFAPIMGFSRAVRVGNFVSVGGTAPIGEDGKTVGINDPAAQTEQCIKTIESALKDVGASLKDVIRTRMILTNIDLWKEIAEVRGKYFKEILPVDTVMEVSSFINPEWLVEIEVDAIIDDN